jgi:hypothetical protein
MIYSSTRNSEEFEGVELYRKNADWVMAFDVINTNNTPVYLPSRHGRFGTYVQNIGSSSPPPLPRSTPTTQ